MVSAKSLLSKFPMRPPDMTVDHLVVGGGVIGLAISEALVKRFPRKTTYLVERKKAVGQETSSRSSEVIHAGIYYPKNSLKTRFCTRGRDLLYERCKADSIPHKKTGKLVVAGKNKRNILYVGELFSHTQDPLVNTESFYLTGDEAREMEPALSPELMCALYSPLTGIVDSHSLMSSMQSNIESSPNGEIVLGTQVLRIEPSFDPTPSNPNTGYLVQMLTSGSTTPDVILAKSLVLSTGLSTFHLLNSLLPSDIPQITPHYAKGSYLSYSGKGAEGINTLIYPVPEQDMTGLGTHLTLDLDGKVRFGPDIEWIGENGEWKEDMDFWEKQLGPSEERKELMFRAISSYLPNVEYSGLKPDYAGIRPNIVGPGETNPDFKIYHSIPKLPNFVGLANMSSPGLTSSLAIGEGIERFFAREIYASEPEAIEGELGPVVGNTKEEWWGVADNKPWWKVW
ncbi:Predicted FAD-dependent oxidoreductase [Phaffia rhodozyma]|uniref:L-2-hydroxyglutarate dehydrogenase, mitochondrial n=1 Tax=Phaffia rhodozyma TaxID=264483 RepID=A0A0F7SXA5_PHARH|nr:Predicted FAD-dependent oxidoreductase [Phaffia rhodozyma]